MTQTASSFTIHRLVESAILIAIGTVLSMFPFSGPWALGGGITLCSMLPLILISHRYGCKWGVFSALVYGLVQMFLGLVNVQYATSALMAAGIILLDYLVAFGVVGLAAMFNGVIKNRVVSIVVGTGFTFALRLGCHFVSGVWIWGSLWPNELGWAAPLWSITYNGSFMVPEFIITAVVAALLFVPLKKYFLALDIQN